MVGRVPLRAFGDVIVLEVGDVITGLSGAGLTAPLGGTSLFGGTVASLAGIDALQGYEGGPPESASNAIPELSMG